MNLELKFKADFACRELHTLIVLNAIAKRVKRSADRCWLAFGEMAEYQKAIERSIFLD